MHVTRIVCVLIALVTLSSVGASQSSPDFLLEVDPAELTVAPGNAATFKIRVTSIGGFASTVTLQLASVTPRPAVGYLWGCSCQVTPTPQSAASTDLRFQVHDPAEATYVVTVRGYVGQIERTVSMTMRVERPKDAFRLVASVGSAVLTHGDTPGSIEVVVTVVPYGRYNSPVTVSCPGGPGMTITFDKTTLAPWESARMTITKYLASPRFGGGLRVTGTGSAGLVFGLDVDINVIPNFPYATGDQSVLFIPVRLRDAARTAQIDPFRLMIARTVEYYSEVSYGQLRLVPDLLDRWYDIPGTDNDYFAARRSLISDVLAAIDADVDFTRYRRYVFLIEGWFSLPASGLRFGYRDTNEGPVLISIAYLPAGATASTQHLMIHELGHTFYLPDLYYREGPESFFAGWDVMAEPLGPPANPYFNGWSRLKLGWLSSDEVLEVRPGETQAVRLSPITLQGGGVKLIRIPRVALPEKNRSQFTAFPPTFTEERSYFIEARQRSGFDAQLPSDGVLIYAVDETMFSGSGPVRLIDANPFTSTVGDAAFSPNVGESGNFEDAANGLTISIVHRTDGLYDIDVRSLPYGRATLDLRLNGPGAVASTEGSAGVTQSGYANGDLTSGKAPYATAVISYQQNGIVVSEVGVPVAQPTTSARVFVDFRTAVPVPGAAGTVDIRTGFAAVNRGIEDANISITLRDLNGNQITSGTGVLKKDAHLARFVDEFHEVFTGFSLPPTFSSSLQFGTLEIQSDQPVAVTALRLTTNQRGEVLLTTTPVADLTKPPSTSAVFFPHLADGDGYATSLFLLNTTGQVLSGKLRAYSSNGAPLELRMINGTTASEFAYSIPAGGANIFQSDGTGPVKVGWLQATPDSGSVPVGLGLFQYSQAGVLVTESGIASAVPTKSARIFVDTTAGHDTGLALVNSAVTALNIKLDAFDLTGSRAANQVTTPLTGRGHTARFLGQFVSGLPTGFRGVLDISADTPFLALTLRSLVNARGDFLLTTFPVADLSTSAPVPVLFPHIADGGGYRTEFILLGGGSSNLKLNILSSEGTPLAIAR